MNLLFPSRVLARAPDPPASAMNDVKLVSIPANPAPDGVMVGRLKTPDGVNLRFARWAPPPGRKGTVCIFPGRTEFIEKYFETVRDLRARGFAVTVLDWRGQGLSDRALADRGKGHVEDFAQYDLDLETFMTQVALPDCPPPLFGLGHSTGAAVLIRAAAHGHRWFDRMLLAAPLIKLVPAKAGRFDPFMLRVLRTIGLGRAYIPGGSATPEALCSFVQNITTSDPVRHARTVAVVEAEPALGIGSPTIGWADAAFRAMAEFADPTFGARIRQPMLIVAAGSDQVVSTAAAEAFARQLRAGSQIAIHGAKHELLMEQDRYRAQFLAAFDAFIPGTPLY